MLLEHKKYRKLYKFITFYFDYIISFYNFAPDFYNLWDNYLLEFFIFLYNKFN